MLHSDTQLTPTAQRSVAVLRNREEAWNEQQRTLQRANDQKKSQKAHGVQAYQKRVLQNCKSWGGPCVTTDDLDQALQKANDEEFCVTQEITYYKLTHPTEFSQNRHMFRVRGISVGEKMENLRSILSDEEDMETTRRSVGQLPTNKDVMHILRSNNTQSDNDTTPPPQQQESLEVFINSLVLLSGL